MDRESRETWAKRVERWRDSGLTAKEFAAEMGINEQLAMWQAHSRPPRDKLHAWQRDGFSDMLAVVAAGSPGKAVE